MENKRMAGKWTTHRTSAGHKWPNDSFEIPFLLLCCSSSFKFLHLRLPIVFVSFRVPSNSLTLNVVGCASCPNFLPRFIHKRRKRRLASEGSSNWINVSEGILKYCKVRNTAQNDFTGKRDIYIVGYYQNRPVSSQNKLRASTEFHRVSHCVLEET